MSNNLRRQAIQARTHARRALLQLLYQWQISQSTPAETYDNRLLDSRVGDIDMDYLQEAFNHITSHSDELEFSYSTFIDRQASSIDAIERAILWIGAYEIRHRPDIHSTVSINEAVELSKQFGANDSYTFINATLDKLAKS